jgi:hypothetical protein
MWLPLIESAVVVGAGGAAMWLLRRGGPRTAPGLDPAVVQALAGAVMAQVRTPHPGTTGGEAFTRVWAQAEQVGWIRLLAEGVLRPVGQPRADPGNPLGTRLVLAEHVTGAFGDCRVLLAVDPSPGPDGAHDLVAIAVPSWIDDAVSAAAWTYGCPRDVYAGLARRT